MKKKFDKILQFYQTKFKGKSDEFINDLAMTAWNSEVYDKTNRYLVRQQEKMLKRGLKHHTLKWTLETLELISKVKEKFGLDIKQLSIRGLIKTEPDLKSVMLIVLARNILKIKLFFKKIKDWSDKMDKDLTETYKVIGDNHQIYR